MLKVKRVYEPPGPDDGLRVLIDRLWPRGVKKEGARIDLWAKELAPSGELREWFGHRPERFAEFRIRYLAELSGKRSELHRLAQRARDGTVTLVFAARDAEHSNAAVLRELVEGGTRRSRAPDGPSRDDAPG
jgi:uncharacterized protein YeaO (DUF488 family)